MDKAAGIFRQIISAISQGASAAAAANSFIIAFAADAL
jgi:thioredoxin reductase